MIMQNKTTKIAIKWQNKTHRKTITKNCKATFYRHIVYSYIM